MSGSRWLRGAWLIGAALSSCSPAKTSDPAPKVPPAPQQAKSELDQRLAELDDERTREHALGRLKEMFADALARSENDRSRDPAKRFIDASVVRLSELYVLDQAELRADERALLLELLGHYDDPRSEPALRFALDAFSAKPDGTIEVLDSSRALKAAASLRLPGLDAPLLRAFLALRASSEAGVLLSEHLENTLFTRRSPTWVEPLLSVLSAELPGPPVGDEPETETFRDQLFRQATATRVLGQIGDPRAVDPLFAVLLAPKKLPLHRDALRALVSIGAPARAAAIRLLGQGGEAARAASEVLGMSGHPDAISPLLAELRVEKDAATRVFFALALTRLPATPDTITTYQRVYESLPGDATLESHVPALEQLAGASTLFFDSNLVDWLLARVERARSGDQQQALRSALLQSALLLARPRQLPSLKAALDRYGAVGERTVYDQIVPLLSRCGEDPRCYLAEFDTATNPQPGAECVGIKAAWMVGIVGGGSLADALVDRLRRGGDLNALFASTFVLGHLTPLDSNAIAEKLDALVVAGHWSRDTVRRMLSSPQAPLRDTLARLRGRTR